MSELNALFQAGNQNQAPAEVDADAALAELVGEGKKYATTAELAKAMVHSQTHIGTLEQEAAVQREQSSSAKSIEDVLAAIQGQQPAPTQQQQAADQQPAQQPTGELTIAEQIAAAFSQRDEQSVATTQANNRATLVADLSKTYGAEAQALLQQVEKDLGIDLNELAGKSPTAVMKLIADARPAPQQNLNQALPTGQQQHQLAPQGGQGVLNQSAIKQLFVAGKITMTQKHEMENKQLTALGSNAFYK